MWEADTMGGKSFVCGALERCSLAGRVDFEGYMHHWLLVHFTPVHCCVLLPPASLPWWAEIALKPSGNPRKYSGHGNAN